MFIILAAILIFELLSFGGVLPHTWFATAVLWTVAAALCLIQQAIEGKRFDTALLTGSIAIAALGWFTGAKFAVGLFAGLWAWRAANRNPRNVPKFLHAMILIGILEALMGLTQHFLLPSW